MRVSEEAVHAYLEGERAALGKKQPWARSMVGAGLEAAAPILCEQSTRDVVERLAAIFEAEPGLRWSGGDVAARLREAAAADPAESS